MSLLQPFKFNMIADPWILLVLVAVFALLLAELFRRPAASLSVSTGGILARVRGKKQTLVRHVPALLRALALTFLVIALARPMQGLERRTDRANVVDIMLCVDVSASMTAADFFANGEPRDRLYVTKAAVGDFIDSRKVERDDRYGLDRIGLILYGTFAWTQCPLTLDYGVLEREIVNAHVARDVSKSQTAIGSAIGLAVSRLRDSEAKSKVIILLTDGINNSGQLDPITAAKLAADYGIKVYTIGAGSTEGGVARSRGILGLVTRRSDPIDEAAMKSIAEVSGGKYYRATDTESLLAAYDEINRLEATEIDVGDYFEYKEGFVPYASAGMIAMIASIFARRRWFDPIP
jgi:Ca-activated chloride channel family protein